MNPANKTSKKVKGIWILHLLLIALAAYLIASVGHGLIGHELREEALAELKARRAARKAPEPEPRKDNRVIVERNYFGSAKQKLTDEEKARLKAMGFAQPHLKPDTVKRVFALAGEKVPEFILNCHIVEGHYCSLEGGAEPKPIPKELAIEVTSQVGPKYLEHAKDNGARMRCQAKGVCFIDWGWGEGWEPLPDKPLP